MSTGGAAAAAIAWIDGPGGGRWGAPGQLSVPLSERGLSLADGLFETVLVEGGRPRLLEAHLQRWCRGAKVLDLPPPPGLERLLELAAEAISRSGIHTGALRLNWSRGDGERGLDLPAGGAARFWLQLSPCRPAFQAVGVIVSRLECRNASSALSGCKTFAYGASLLARREAREAGQDDALLLSTAGGLCCGTTANLLVRHGGRWLTPPLASGCLAGVMRGQALDQGLAQEAGEAIEPDQLQAGALLLNSLGCRPIQSLAGQELAAVPEAERFWRQLLGEG